MESIINMLVKRILNYSRKKDNEPKMIPVPTQFNTTELLRGKVALITGGSGGIGNAIAESFLKNGCKVIIAGTSQEKLDNSVKKLGDNMDVRALVIDVTKVNLLAEKVELAAQFFGHIDILVNSAGVNCFTDFLAVTEDEYDTDSLPDGYMEATEMFMMAEDISGKTPKRGEVLSSEGTFEIVIEKAESGDPEAKFTAGKYFIADHIEDETERAIRWIREAADEGIEEAQDYINTHSELFE